LAAAVVLAVVAQVEGLEDLVAVALAVAERGVIGKIIYY
jgi:hypothetical protein